MARPKKGQLMQFMAPVRSSSDGSLITTMTASDFNSGAVCKWFGTNHGTSTAFTSGTMSKVATLVSSGLLQFTINATENNYDEMVFRARKTSMKPMFVAWNNTDYDDSDIMSRLSDIGSDLRSYMVALSAELSNVESQVDLIPTVNNSDAISDIFALLSDLDSNFQSRVPKRVATDSQLSDVASDIKSAVTVAQSMVSDIQSFLSDFQSDLLSHVDTTGVGLNASTMSDLRSAINALTVTIGASDISDIASAVVAGLPITSQVSDIYSLLSDLNSVFGTRVPKEVAARSQVSDLSSDLRSYLVGISGALSDVESQLDLVPTANNSDTISKVYAMLSDFQSDFGSRVPKAVATNSQVSDLASDLRSYLVALSGALSDVESQLDLVPTTNSSDAISNVYSLLALVASNVSDVESQIDAGIEIGASSMSDIRSALTAGVGLNASALSDVVSAIKGRTFTEPSAPPSFSSSHDEWLAYWAAISINEIDQTSGVRSIRNAADNANIASMAVSDDGTTFVDGAAG